ncbi:unnamed protein product [Caenorhabditis brenneri]
MAPKLATVSLVLLTLFANSLQSPPSSSTIECPPYHNGSIAGNSCSHEYFKYVNGASQAATCSEANVFFEDGCIPAEQSPECQIADDTEDEPYEQFDKCLHSVGCPNSFVNCVAEMYCPDDLVFNAKTSECQETCDDDGDFECVNKVRQAATCSEGNVFFEDGCVPAEQSPECQIADDTEDEPYEQFDCLSRPKGLHSVGCTNSFVNCVAGQAYEMYCPDDLVFDGKTSKCQRDEDDLNILINSASNFLLLVLFLKVAQPRLLFVLLFFVNSCSAVGKSRQKAVKTPGSFWEDELTYELFQISVYFTGFDELVEFAMEYPTFRIYLTRRFPNRYFRCFVIGTCKLVVVQERGTASSIRSNSSSAFVVNQVASTSMSSVGGEREASQIARKLYELKSCTSTDVADKLNEQNDFSFLILVKYLELFQFSTTRIDAALREFLSRVELRGESSARERLLRVFSARYLECNPSIFESLDEVHTLTCALLLLNSDLHGPNTGKKMTSRDFITNIGHTGCTYKREMLKTLYQSIKDNAISLQQSSKSSTANGSAASSIKQQRVLEVDPEAVVEYHSSFLMRKYVREADGAKTPFGRRSWKMVYARLRGLVLYFDSDEHPKATSRYASLENAVSLHHALAEPAPDYKKKSYVFRVRIAHGGEILFQTSNERDLNEWCAKINFVAAAFSSPTLPLPVTSKPETAPMPRLPRLPCLAPITKQLRTHESRVTELSEMIEVVLQSLYPERPQQQILDRLVLLGFEKRRYTTYINVLRQSLDERKATSITTMNVVMSPKHRAQQKSSTVCDDRLSYTDAVNGAS